MNIIAGSARNLILADLPDQEVRPTAIRSRKALFDSLGAMEGLGVLDLCSGSGAIALEAASRGAAWAAWWKITRHTSNVSGKTAAGSPLPDAGKICWSSNQISSISPVSAGNCRELRI